MLINKKRFLEGLMLFQISILTIIQSWNGFIIIPNYNLIAVELGVSNFYLGLMSGLYLLLGGLSSPFWAYLADSIGIKRKWLLALSLLFAGTLTILISYAVDKILFFLSRVATGIFLGALNPLIFSVIADRFESNLRGRAYMIWYFISGVGLAIGFVSSVVLGAYFGWRYPIRVNGFALLVVGVPAAMSLLEPARGTADLRMLRILDGEYLYTLHLEDLKLLFRNRTLIYVSIEEFLSTAPQGVLLAWLTQYVIFEMKATNIVAIVYLGLGMLGGLLGFFVVHLADRLFEKDPRNRIKIAFISMTIQAILLMVFLLLPIKLGITDEDPIQSVLKFLEIIRNNWVVLGSIIIFFVSMMFNSAIEPIKNAVISDVNLPEQRAIVSSGIATIELFVRSASIALAGLIIDLTGSIRFTLVAFVVLYFVAGGLWRLAENSYPSDIEYIRAYLLNRVKNNDAGVS